MIESLAVMPLPSAASVERSQCDAAVRTERTENR
jgi:hypothetical protein